MKKFDELYKQMVIEGTEQGSLTLNQVTQTITQINTRVTGVLLQTFREMLNAEVTEGHFKGVIVTDEDGQITVYCLSHEVDSVVDAIEQGIEDFVNDEYMSEIDGQL